MLGGDEGNTSALVACAPSTPSSVDVILHMIRRIIVNDQLELLDIKTTSSNRSGNNNGNDTRLEISDGGVAIDLVLSSMQGHAEVAFPH